MNTDAPCRLAHRRLGWEKCFQAALGRAQTRDFKFGVFDCCMWAADAVNAITGVDPAASLRGTYHTRDEAHAVITARGGMEQMIDTLCTSVGLVPWNPALAQRGDVVLLAPHDGFPGALGVVVGSNAAAPAVRRGLTYVPLTLALRAWHIPHAFRCPQFSQQ